MKFKLAETLVWLDVAIKQKYLFAIVEKACGDTCAQNQSHGRKRMGFVWIEWGFDPSAAAITVGQWSLCFMCLSAVAAAAQGALGVTRMGRTDEGIEEDLEKQRHNFCSLRNSGWVWASPLPKARHLELISWNWFCGHLLFQKQRERLQCYQQLTLFKRVKIKTLLCVPGAFAYIELGGITGFLYICLLLVCIFPIQKRMHAGVLCLEQ